MSIRSKNCSCKIVTVSVHGCHTSSWVDSWQKNEANRYARRTDAILLLWRWLRAQRRPNIICTCWERKAMAHQDMPITHDVAEMYIQSPKKTEQIAPACVLLLITGNNIMNKSAEYRPARTYICMSDSRSIPCASSQSHMSTGVGRNLKRRKLARRKNWKILFLGIKSINTA